MSLTLRQSHLLTQWREQNAAAGFPFAPTDYWAGINVEFDKRFREEGIEDVERQWYNAHFSSFPPDYRYLPDFIQHLGGSTPYPCEPLEYMCRLYYGELLGRHCGPYPWCAESVLMGLEASEKSYRYLIEGHWINWDLLITLDTFHVLSSVIGKHKTYAELGAGWGRVGWILRQLHPVCRYLVFDLPESLLISYTYLPNLLGEPGFLSHSPTVPGCYFAPSQDLLKVPDKSIDVFISVASFQEMTGSQCTAYLNLIEKKARFVYLQQRGGLEDRDGRYAVAKHWRQLYHRRVSWSPLYFEALWQVP